MDAAIHAALDQGQRIDLTTTGRRTGEARRIEIVYHNVDGRIVISGSPSPRRRAWLANIEANPAVTIHFKGPAAHGDIAATAHEITDPADRRHLMEAVARNWRRTDVDVMLEQSPLIEVDVPGYPG
jgi:deazaflavin-dependent oxidoreductase (nitroreductase family)